MAVLAAGWLALTAAAASGRIDRDSVVRRHNVRFASEGQIPPLNVSTVENVFTVGNGEIAFTADLTGLQSLNASYHLSGFPLYTLSNWGWHTPHPAAVGAKQRAFNDDGTLNYVYENVTISSSDTRPGKGNRTVPYQFNCASHNDPNLCNFFHTFPARVNLGQIAFVLPAPPPPPPSPPRPPLSCDGVGDWCNSGDGNCFKTGGHTITVARAPAGSACVDVANCTWGPGWHDAPFCLLPGGRINMTGVTPGKANLGHFDGSCDRIQWDNPFDHSAWCRRGGDPAACAGPPSPPGGGGGPAGPFEFLDIGGFTHTDQTLDMWTGVLSSSFRYAHPARAKASGKKSSGSDTYGGTGGGSTSGDIKIGKAQAQSSPIAVDVTTAVDTESDAVSVRYTAPAAAGLSVQIAFCNLDPSGLACTWEPFAGDGSGGPLTNMSTTVLGSSTDHDGRGGRIDLFRAMGHDTHAVSCKYKLTDGPGTVALKQTAAHAFALFFGSGGDDASGNDSGAGVSGAATGGRASTAATDGPNRTVELTCAFESVCCVGPNPPRDKATLAGKPVVSVADAVAHSTATYEAFWEGGAFADIAGATSDPDAIELERRTIQSLFLMRSQESGSVPPQESALLFNSWTGKHHSEMRYWHQTWMPIWGHPELLARSDEWFVQRLSNASSHAARQGYKGCRWGKMLGESNVYGVGRGDGTKPLQYWESPNNINPGLVWHQPHVVYMAELEYRAAPNASAKQEVLDRMSEVVLCTAEFLADFPERMVGTGTNGKWLDIGPPLVTASEGDGPAGVWNPTYELTQFNFSLDLAQQWLERLGRPRNDAWEDVRMNLAPLPVVTLANGMRTYNRHQNCLPNVFTHGATDCGGGPQSHPALTGALGCLPADYGVDADVMNATLHETLSVWEWEHCWGWDQPMVAMTAVRLNQPDVAVSTLLMKAGTNDYLPTGYNHPSSYGMISAYLPGNGGTLIAVGLMAGGWEGAPDREAPGFPEAWKVRAEGFTPYF